MPQPGAMALRLTGAASATDRGLVRADTRERTPSTICHPPAAILFGHGVAFRCQGRLAKNSKENGCSHTTAPYTGRRSEPVLASGRGKCAAPEQSEPWGQSNRRGGWQIEAGLSSSAFLRGRVYPGKQDCRAAPAFSHAAFSSGGVLASTKRSNMKTEALQPWGCMALLILPAWQDRAR